MFARKRLGAARAKLDEEPGSEQARREVRTARGRVGGLTRSLGSYTHDIVRAAQQANRNLSRYELQVDPEGLLDPTIRRRKALAARRRFYKKPGMLGQKAKKRKQEIRAARARRRAM